MITMKRTFSLSANIENGFADGAQYIVTPNAQLAIRNIVNDYQTGIHSFTIIGSYGTGKSSFLLALESDLKRTNKKSYLLDVKNLLNIFPNKLMFFPPIYFYKNKNLYKIALNYLFVNYL